MKKKSLNQKILLPMLYLIGLQIIILIFVLSLSGILTQAEQNSIDILHERVINRSNYLETEMLNHWSQINDAVASINDAANAAFQFDSTGTLRLDENPDTYIPFLTRVSDDVLLMLRSTATTGAFLILNQEALSNVEIKSKAGIYVRNSNPSSPSSKSNDDLTFEIAPFSICQAMNISTSSNWNVVFDFSSANNGYYPFFINPYNEALHHSDLAYFDLGYWSAPYYLTEDDSVPSISYSVPLIADNGTVYGVLGVEINLTYLAKFLPYAELSDTYSAYILTLSHGHNDSMQNLFINGPLYQASLNDAEATYLFSSKYYSGYYLSSGTDTSNDFLGCIDSLNLYNTNTPFSNQHWSLIGVSPSSTLFAFSNKILLSLIFSFSFVFFISLIALLFLSQILANPIKLLVRSIRNSDPKKPITLPKTRVNEIDELSASIETLSQEVYSSASKFTQIIEMSTIHIGGFDVNLSRQSLFITQHFFSLFGYHDVNVSELSYEEFKRYMFQLDSHIIKRQEEENGRYTVTYHIIDASGNNVWIRLKNIQTTERWTGLAEDVTQEMMEMKKLEHERDYDILTNLMNRRAFDNKVLDLFANHSNRLKIAALVMFDLDNLKYINDTYGHDYGDSYIRIAANAFCNSTPSDTLISRRSGDEFYLFFYGYTSQDALRGSIDLLVESLNSKELPLPDKHTYRLRASGGVAWYPIDTFDYNLLLKFADFAMYKAKHTAKGSILDFNLSVYEAESYLLQSEEELALILETEALIYYFQPIVSARDGSVYAYEALMRSTMKSLNSCESILTIAKKEGKLNQIERLTWFKSMEAFANHIHNGHIAPNCKLFMNSLPNQNLSSQDVRLFESLYSDYLSQLVLEIIEEEKIDVSLQNEKLRQLELWNAELALDDYGSGYNSDITLLNMSPNYVKIDLNIIRNIHNDSAKQKIVENVVSYAHERNIFLIAEGIEIYEEAQTVIDLGVDYLQGFYYARPSYIIENINPERIKEIKALNASKNAPQ